MSFYERVILPRLLRLGMSSGAMKIERAACLKDVTGRVLEVGFGNGLNLPFYGNGVTEVVGIDPSPAAEKLSRKEMKAVTFPVHIHTGTAEALPFADGEFDAVVTTWTLCSIPDPAAALREMIRVARPGAPLYFAEHGLSSSPRVATWQHRLNGMQKFMFGGCHLDRRIDQLITDAGYHIESLANYYVKGEPKTHSYMYRGVARAPGKAA